MRLNYICMGMAPALVLRTCHVDAARHALGDGNDWRPGVLEQLQQPVERLHQRRLQRGVHHRRVGAVRPPGFAADRQGLAGCAVVRSRSGLMQECGSGQEPGSGLDWSELKAD